MSRVKEIIHPLPPDKGFLRTWNKYFLTEICRNMQTFAFQALRECISWASRNGAVQMGVFLRFFARDIFLEIGFCVILQSIQNFFGPGTTRISSGALNYTVKLVIFFGSFCGQWWLTFLLSPIFC